MRTLSEIDEKLEAYRTYDLIYEPDIGYIAWHCSTGENIEVLFIEAAFPGIGQGVELYRLMIEDLLRRNSKPYHSIFAFRLASNNCARRFYDRMGWTQVNLGQSIYAGDKTVLMWVTWEDILSYFHLEERTDD